MLNFIKFTLLIADVELSAEEAKVHGDFIALTFFRKVVRLRSLF